MHYKKLIEAHKLFYGGSEHRAPFYDDYMQSRNGGQWETGSVSIMEIEKLFNFILSWDCHFNGDSSRFKQIYEHVRPIIDQLRGIRVEDLELDDRGLRDRIRYVFDRIADCPRIRRYESTDASKILHTILPQLIIMWDDKIRKGVSVGSKGIDYVNVFLPKMKQEIEEALRTCMNEERMNRLEAVAYIREQCDNKTVAKLVDQFNYMKYTKQHPSMWQ